MTNLKPTIYGKGQNVVYQELLTLLVGGNADTWRNGTPHNLRITIRTDSHPNQAYARVERWDGSAWREVWQIDGPLMLTDQGLGYQRREAQATDFAADRALLLEHAKRVLR